MQPLQYFAIGLSSLSGALFLGFLTAANPNFIGIHFIVVVAIVALFVVNGLGQSRSYISYNRGMNPILVNFGLSALVVVLLYLAIIGVGAWTYSPTIPVEDSFESIL